MESTRLLTFALLAFTLSSTAALADCPPGVVQQTIQRMNAKGRHIQPSQVECKRNGMKGQNVMLISVGNDLVGSCFGQGGKSSVGAPKRTCRLATLAEIGPSSLPTIFIKGKPADLGAGAVLLA
ncbi:hypothetical protein [Bradyrhizobium sp. Gha]|uniref:hypothetical protein n=1 Tax=Bradyrhizobium sp. Gha TaxID=1855318 RepID=UPI001160A78F|nr:hypothetical protein [Bradyrhizobium sp. Gha]